MSTDFAEWKARKHRNQQLRKNWHIIKAHVTDKGLQDGSAAVKDGKVVWTPAGQDVRGVESYQFAVIDGMVYM